MEPSHSLSATEQQEAQGPATGLDFDIARSLEDVLEAWHLLYEAYLRVGFIRANPYELHTVPQAIGPQALVILGRIDGLAVGTISAIGDGPGGLPLDSACPEELNELRAEGRKLIEIGLFGDRRDLMGEAGRTFHALFELMRHTYYFGLHLGATDFLCGIPPKRTRLYYRAFGFRPVGEVKSYATVEDNPVQLLHVEADYVREQHSQHRALGYFAQNPMPESLFDGRFRFAPEALAGSPLEGFLKAKCAAG